MLKDILLLVHPTLGGRGIAAIVIGSTVASGLIILAAAAALALE